MTWDEPDTGRVSLVGSAVPLSFRPGFVLLKSDGRIVIATCDIGSFAARDYV